MGRFRKIQIRFFALGVIILAGLILITLFTIPQYLSELTTAYLLSYLFVGVNLIVIENFDSESYKVFYRRFLLSMALRFVLLLAALILILQMIKFHQIFFTVSFIISYILHSVIEIISINQLLQTDN